MPKAYDVTIPSMCLMNNKSVAMQPPDVHVVHAYEVTKSYQINHSSATAAVQTCWHLPRCSLHVLIVGLLAVVTISSLLDIRCNLGLFMLHFYLAWQHGVQVYAAILVDFKNPQKWKNATPDVTLPKFKNRKRGMNPNRTFKFRPT